MPVAEAPAPHTEDDVDVQLVARSLRHFTKQAWPIVYPGKPLHWGWHNDVICEALEAVSAGEITHLLLNVYPRSGKSTTVSVMWPAWEWIKRPELSYLTLSYGDRLALRDAHRSRLIMRHQGTKDAEGTTMQRLGYRHFVNLAGEPWEFADDQDAKSRYRNDHQGERIATSVGGWATGEGGERIVLDDPQKMEGPNREGSREEAINFVTEILPNRLNAADSAAVCIQQRLSEDDVTATLLEEGGWEHICLPMEYEPSHPFVWPRDPRTEPGQLLSPERHSPEWVAKEKARSARSWASKYQQRPAPAEGGLFKRDDWQQWTELPHAWEKMLCSWDLTHGDKVDPSKDRSFVVGQLWGKDGPSVYLLAQVRGRFAYPDQKKAIKALVAFAASEHATRYQDPIPTVVEKAAIGAAIVTELSMDLPGIRAEPVQGDKFYRAEAYQPMVQAGNVYLPAAHSIPAPLGYEPTPVNAFVEELAVFNAGAHDDQVDAFSQALRELFGSRPDGVTIVPSERGAGEPVYERGDIRKVGKRYIDKEDRPRRRR